MSAPVSVKEARSMRTTGKRKVNSLMKEADLPVVRDLLKQAEKAKPKTSAPDLNNTSQTRMAKLKFPTFSGDLRDYKRFKELFSHFSRHLGAEVQLYQLVESMERNTEKRKIKACFIKR